MFAIKHFPELGEILLSDGRKHTETWNAQKEHWECHAEDTIRTVETEVVLLYRVLPAGIAGDRLHDCPQLSEEISKQHKGAFRSAPKRRRVLDDDDDDRRAPTKRLRAPTLASGTDQVMFDKSQESPLRIDASMPLLPSQQLAKPSQTQVKQAVAGPGDNSSNKPVPGVASGNNNVLLKTRPLASNEVSTSGERLFPASFYAVDVIEGFECMDDLMKQRRPRIYQGAAFTAVFGLPYVRSTYQKHRRIYDDNQDLVPKFKAHARSSKGTWTKFRLDGMEIVDPDSESEVQDRDSKGVSEEQDVDEYGTFGEGDGGHENPFDLEKHEHSPEYDNAHWATCCAYCDELIVPQQSGKLLRLQEHLDSKSILDGTNGKDASRNPYHRYIRPITATTEYCAQHRFESTVIPAVLLKATWAAALPVDFDALPIRLEELKPMLDETVNSPFDNVFFRALCESVKGQGLTRTLGAEGEYLSFRKTSAG
jgi:hypothetical protein